MNNNLAIIISTIVVVCIILYYSSSTKTYRESLNVSDLIRYIKISQPRGPLELSEVSVFVNAENIAPVYGRASQSSTRENNSDKFGAARAITGTHAGREFTHYTRTKDQDPDPWWLLDLKREFPVSHIIIHFPQRGAHPHPNSTLYPHDVDKSVVEFLNDESKVVATRQIERWREIIVLQLN